LKDRTEARGGEVWVIEGHVSVFYWCQVVPKYVYIRCKLYFDLQAKKEFPRTDVDHS
jgi:hypothetical protein